MTISSVGFSGRVPRLCAQKKNANLPYPVKKVCSFFYKCPLEHCTVFSNYLLDCERTGNMGTSFFTPLWQIECTSLVIATLKENDNFLYPQKKVYVTFEMCRSSAKKKEKLRPLLASQRNFETTSLLTPSSTPFGNQTPVAQAFG